MFKFLFSDILWALLISYTAFAAYSFMPSFINRLELSFYDFRMAMLSIPPNVLPCVIEVPADKSYPSMLSFEDTENILSLLSQQENSPELTVFTSRISIPESNSSAREIAMIKEKYDELKKQKKITDKGNDFSRLISQMQNREKPEKKISSYLSKIGKYIMPVSFEAGTPTAKPRQEPEWLSKFSARSVSGAALASAKSESVSFSAQEGDGISDKAAGIGHDGIFPEQDGRTRFECPFIAYNHNLYPSIALEAARVIMNIEPGKMRFVPARELRIGEKSIPLTSESMMPVYFSKVEPLKYSSKAIIGGTIAPETFKGRIVIISAESQNGIITPKGEIPRYSFLVSAIKTMMSDFFVSRPEWTYKAELGMLLAAGIFIAFASILPAALFHSVFAIMAVMFFAVPLYMFSHEHIWIKPMVPAMCLALGYVFGTVKRFVLRYELKKIQYSNKPPPLPRLSRKAKTNSETARQPDNASIRNKVSQNPTLITLNATDILVNNANAEYTAERQK